MALFFWFILGAIFYKQTTCILPKMRIVYNNI
nr:MAG TPA: hypothetical protein [Caudoviricetes sp.]